MRALIGVVVFGLWACGMDQAEYQDNRSARKDTAAPGASTANSTPGSTTPGATTPSNTQTPASTDTKPTDTKTPPPATPAAPAVSFAKDVQPLIMRSCLGACHTTANPQGMIALDSLANVQRNFTAALAAMERASMPSVANRQKMSAAEIATLKKWRDAKFPQ